MTPEEYTARLITIEKSIQGILQEVRLLRLDLLDDLERYEEASLD